MFVRRLGTSTPPREPTFWLSEVAAEHSRTGCSGPARPLRGTRRILEVRHPNTADDDQPGALPAPTGGRHRGLPVKKIRPRLSRGLECREIHKSANVGGAVASKGKTPERDRPCY